MSVTAIKEQITKVTNEEDLNEIYRFAFDQYKTVRRRKAETINWEVGQKVQMKREYQTRKPYCEIGKIIKVNKVKVVVDFGELSKWNIPKGMLNVVE